MKSNLILNFQQKNFVMGKITGFKKRWRQLGLWISNYPFYRLYFDNKIPN